MFVCVEIYKAERSFIHEICLRSYNERKVNEFPHRGAHLNTGCVFTVNVENENELNALHLIITSYVWVEWLL